MKLVISLLVMISQACLAQNLFTNEEFKLSLVNAQDSNKLTLLYFHTNWCGPCRQMEETTFKNQEVVSFIKQNFNAYQLDGDSPKGKALSKIYSIHAYPSYLLIDNKGQLLYKAMSYMPPEIFVRRLKYGITEASNPDNLIQLTERYQKDQTNTNLLRALIEKRIYSDLNNSDLLDTLLVRLPADSLATPSVLRLIMLCFTSGSEQSTIRSRAFALLKNQKKLATAHQSIEAFPEYGQSLFNRADKSIDIAQATKDVPLFEEAISMYLELNPHSSASISLKRQKALRQMDFYKDLGLIDKLAKATISFCEDSLMRLKEENIMLLAASCVSRGSIIDETLPYDQKVNVCRQYIIGNMASDLNRGAWGFYERIINKTLLNQAIGWSRRSLTLTEEANYLDTLAHLLYKVGQVDEAMLYESKAVEVAKQKGEDSLAFQNVLNQMKGKTLR